MPLQRIARGFLNGTGVGKLRDYSNDQRELVVNFLIGLLGL